MYASKILILLFLFIKFSSPNPPLFTFGPSTHVAPPVSTSTSASSFSHISSSHPSTSSAQENYALIVISNTDIKYILNRKISKISAHGLQFLSLDQHEKLDKNDADEIRVINRPKCGKTL